MALGTQEFSNYRVEEEHTIESEGQRDAYEKWIEETGRKFDPFRDNLTEKPKVEFGPYFHRLCAVNSGYDYKGAEAFYHVLEQVPEGYTYAGKTTQERFEEKYDQKTFIVITSDVSDADGNPMEGYIAIARKKNKE